MLAFPRQKSMPPEPAFSSSGVESASEQAELLPERLLRPFLPRITPGWWEGLDLHCQRRLGSGAQVFPSHDWNQISKDGALFESPDEVTRFTARFESLGADHLSACGVVGVQNLWYDALSCLLPVFQQKLLRCWSLLAAWPPVFPLGFHSIAWHRHITGKMWCTSIPCCDSSIQPQSRCWVSLFRQTHLNAISTPQNTRIPQNAGNRWSSKGVMSWITVLRAIFSSACRHAR